MLVTPSDVGGSRDPTDLENAAGPGNPKWRTLMPPPDTGLMVPPIMTNRLPWSKGYFENVDHWPFERGDVLEQHCFRRSNGQYFDEANHELPGPVEPVGDWGLHSYRTIDDEISEALRLPLAPD
jgi:hypothetical protein